MTRQLSKIGASVLTTLLALIVLWQFRVVGLYVLVSLTLAATIRPLFKMIMWGSIPAKAAWAFLYLSALIGFGFLLFLSGDAAIKEIQHLAASISVQDEWMLPGWLKNSTFQQELIPRLPPPSKFLEAVTGDQGQLVLPILFDFSQSIGNVVNAIFVILFLSFYWSLNQINFERLWLSLLPPNQRKQARRIWQTIEIDLGAYIRSEIIQSILAGLLLGTGYWLLGSPYSALLAITGALVWVIPVVGAPLAVILPLFLGLLTSLQLGLFTAIYTLVVLVVVQVWVEPRFFRRKWDNPILTLIILLAMADAFGVLGVIVAPPISAIFQILWNLLGNKRNITGAAAQVSDLKERHAHVLDAVKAMDGPPLPLITSSIERLARLIKKAEPVLQEVLPVISSE